MESNIKHSRAESFLLRIQPHESRFPPHSAELKRDPRHALQYVLVMGANLTFLR